MANLDGLEAKIDEFIAAQSKTNAEIMATLKRIEGRIEDLLAGRVGTDATQTLAMKKAYCIAKGIDLGELLDRESGIKRRPRKNKKTEVVI